MLARSALLDIVRHFTLFMPLIGRDGQVGRPLPAVPGRPQGDRPDADRRDPGRGRAFDRRGGMVWHTQGSGKCLTMVFLVRGCGRTQSCASSRSCWSPTAPICSTSSRDGGFSGETVARGEARKTPRRSSSTYGPGLVFAMIQKYQVRDDEGPEVLEFRDEERKAKLAAEEPADGRPKDHSRLVLDDETFPVLNESEEILVLVERGPPLPLQFAARQLEWERWASSTTRVLSSDSLSTGKGLVVRTSRL